MSQGIPWLAQFFFMFAVIAITYMPVAYQYFCINAQQRSETITITQHDLTSITANSQHRGIENIYSKNTSS